MARLSNHKLYGTWSAMWNRCANDRNPAWPNYGGRGITVCDRWRSFTLFIADMGPRPDGLSLDRIDNNGNYEPGNCRWADRRAQGLNTRRSIAVQEATARIEELIGRS